MNGVVLALAFLMSLARCSNVCLQAEVICVNSSVAELDGVYIPTLWAALDRTVANKTIRRIFLMNDVYAYKEVTGGIDGTSRESQYFIDGSYGNGSVGDPMIIAPHPDLPENSPIHILFSNIRSSLGFWEFTMFHFEDANYWIIGSENANQKMKIVFSNDVFTDPSSSRRMMIKVIDSFGTTFQNLDFHTWLGELSSVNHDSEYANHFLFYLEMENAVDHVVPFVLKNIDISEEGSALRVIRWKQGGYKPGAEYLLVDNVNVLGKCHRFFKVSRYSDYCFYGVTIKNCDLGGCMSGIHSEDEAYVGNSFVVGNTWMKRSGGLFLLFIEPHLVGDVLITNNILKGGPVPIAFDNIQEPLASTIFVLNNEFHDVRQSIIKISSTEYSANISVVVDGNYFGQHRYSMKTESDLNLLRMKSIRNVRISQNIFELRNKFQENIRMIYVEGDVNYENETAAIEILHNDFFCNGNEKESVLHLENDKVLFDNLTIVGNFFSSLCRTHLFGFVDETAEVYGRLLANSEDVNAMINFNYFQWAEQSEFPTLNGTMDEFIGKNNTFNTELPFSGRGLEIPYPYYYPKSNKFNVLLFEFTPTNDSQGIARGNKKLDGNEDWTSIGAYERPCPGNYGGQTCDVCKPSESCTRALVLDINTKDVVSEISPPNNVRKDVKFDVCSEIDVICVNSAEEEMAGIYVHTLWAALWNTTSNMDIRKIYLMNDIYAYMEEPLDGSDSVSSYYIDETFGNGNVDDPMIIAGHPDNTKEITLYFSNPKDTGGNENYGIFFLDDAQYWEIGSSDQTLNIVFSCDAYFEPSGNDNNLFWVIHTDTVPFAESTGIVFRNLVIDIFLGEDFAETESNERGYYVFYIDCDADNLEVLPAPLVTVKDVDIFSEGSTMRVFKSILANTDERKDFLHVLIDNVNVPGKCWRVWRNLDDFLGISILNSDFGACFSGIMDDGVGLLGNVLIEGNSFGPGGGDAILNFVNNELYNDIFVQNNVFREVGFPIRFEVDDNSKPMKIVIRNNEFHDVYQSTVFVANSGSISTTNPLSIIIDGNYFGENEYSMKTSEELMLIWVENIAYMEISQNIFESNNYWTDAKRMIYIEGGAFSPLKTPSLHLLHNDFYCNGNQGEVVFKLQNDDLLFDKLMIVGNIFGDSCEEHLFGFYNEDFTVYGRLVEGGGTSLINFNYFQWGGGYLFPTLNGTMDEFIGSNNTFNIESPFNQEGEKPSAFFYPKRDDLNIPKFLFTPTLDSLGTTRGGNVDRWNEEWTTVGAYERPCPGNLRGESCNICKLGWYFLDPTCVDDCSSNEGYYENDFLCSSCEENCAKCNDSSVCTECGNGYHLLQGNCVVTCTTGWYSFQGVCVEDCSSEGAYFDDVNMCSPCEEHCLKCDNSFVCTECGNELCTNIWNGNCVECSVGGWDLFASIFSSILVVGFFVVIAVILGFLIIYYVFKGRKKESSDEIQLKFLPKENGRKDVIEEEELKEVLK